MGQRAGKEKLRVEMNILEQGWHMTAALAPYPTLYWVLCPRLEEGSCDKGKKSWGQNPHYRMGKQGGRMHRAKRRAMDTYTFWLSLILFRRTLIWKKGEKKQRR